MIPKYSSGLLNKESDSISCEKRQNKFEELAAKKLMEIKNKQ